MYVLVAGFYVQGILLSMYFVTKLISSLRIYFIRRQGSFQPVSAVEDKRELKRKETHFKHMEGAFKVRFFYNHRGQL
jgi:hypothetical protein